MYSEADDAAARAQQNVLVLTTNIGSVNLDLLPELAPASVREVRRGAAVLAAQGRGCGRGCKIYRPEPGFLVQGVLEAPGVYVAVPRHPNPQQPFMMERGLVCWAGGSGGPHWFVNMINQT